MYIHIDTHQDSGLRMLVQQSHRQLALLRFAATTITTARTAKISNERAARQLGGWFHRAPAACWQLPDTGQLLYLRRTRGQTQTPGGALIWPGQVRQTEVRRRSWGESWRRAVAAEMWAWQGNHPKLKASERLTTTQRSNNIAWVIMQLTAKSINDVNYMPATHTSTPSGIHTRAYILLVW